MDCNGRTRATLAIATAASIGLPLKCPRSAVFRIRILDGQMQIFDLPSIYFARAFVHRIHREAVFGEGDHFLDGGLAGHEHDQAVEAGGDAAVGRGAVLEGLGEEAELAHALFLGDADDLEYALLELGVVDSYRP